MEEDLLCVHDEYVAHDVKRLQTTTFTSLCLNLNFTIKTENDKSNKSKITSKTKLNISKNQEKKFDTITCEIKINRRIQRKYCYLYYFPTSLPLPIHICMNIHIQQFMPSLHNKILKYF